MQEKAYKLLAVQEGITNRSAKDLIDSGLVYSGGKKIVMARALMSAKSTFKVEKPAKIKKIFEDDKLIVIDKPAFITSEQIAKKHSSKLLHRLDKETSGVLLLVKDDEFRKKAIEAFRRFEVEKSYIAWVQGVIAEEIIINDPLLTVKRGGSAFTKVSKKGKEALTIVRPLEVYGKRSKIEVSIKTGRTHQIRAHLKHIGYPIIGDRVYGGKPYKRVLLHSYFVKILGYEFLSEAPDDFMPV